MRIFTGFKQALNEITRDLGEMGIRVHPQTMQNKQVADNPDFDTLELQNYVYTVVNTDLSELEPTQPWADLEFEERTSGMRLNPGAAYKTRIDVWDQFLNKDTPYKLPYFCYSYPERFNPVDEYGAVTNQIEGIIDELMTHPDSRQLYLSIWDPRIDHNNMGVHRVPCTLGYLFQLRKGKLNVTYTMRSCDFFTHMQNDIYLATRLRDYIAEKAGVEKGTFTHFIGSLHVYQKDVKDVF